MLLAPENTLAAFELALQHEVDVLEIDVRLTRDGQVMVTHDARVERTCNGSGLVREATLSYLKTLDAGWNFQDINGVRYRGQGHQLLTLHELFELLPAARINIDIKDNDRDAARAVAEVVAKACAEDRVNVGSFHPEAIGFFRQHSPQVSTTATRGEVAQLYFSRSRSMQLPYQYLQIPTHYLGIPLASESFIRFAQSRGLKVVYWTINRAADMSRLSQRGVDGLVTDRFDVAKRLRRQA